MSLHRLEIEPPVLADPVVVAALDGWVDAGDAATDAVALLAADATRLAVFDGDALLDRRARRPTLEIRDGRLAGLTWPELVLHHRAIAGRDLLVLTGPEPDDRWIALADDLVALLRRLGAVGWISLGAIPASVAHTRAVPLLGTESHAGLLRGGVRPGPTGRMRVPAAAISVLEMAAAAAGIPAVGYFAQVPHYVTGAYPPAALALLAALEDHLGIELPRGGLEADAEALRLRLDTAVAADETTRAYVARLEAAVDEARRPEGDDLIGEIERFLRERSAGGD